MESGKNDSELIEMDFNLCGNNENFSMADSVASLNEMRGKTN